MRKNRFFYINLISLKLVKITLYKLRNKNLFKHKLIEKGHFKKTVRRMPCPPPSPPPQYATADWEHLFLYLVVFDLLVTNRDPWVLCWDFLFSCSTVNGWCGSLRILSVTAILCWSMYDSILGMLYWLRALSAVITIILIIDKLSYLLWYFRHWQV